MLEPAELSLLTKVLSLVVVKVEAMPTHELDDILIGLQINMARAALAGNSPAHHDALW